MLALMDSFATKIYGLTIMTKTPHSGTISYFFQNLDLIFSLMVQTVTIFYFLAENIGVEHPSFYVCLDG